MSVFSNKIEKSDIISAEPFLKDPIFKRAVILITEHNKKGSVGFILNKPIKEIRVNDLFKDFPQIEATVYLGGPVKQENLYYIHSYPDLLKNSIQIKENVHIGGDFETLKNYIQVGKIIPEKIRFFLGYSGWVSGQLNNEITEKSWIINSFDSNIIWSKKKYNLLWKDLLKSRGGEFAEIANYPSDPSLN